jgi:hypothetical protein
VLPFSEASKQQRRRSAVRLNNLDSYILRLFKAQSKKPNLLPPRRVEFGISTRGTDSLVTSKREITFNGFTVCRLGSVHFLLCII